MVSVSDLHLGAPRPFSVGRRRLAPQVCVVDSKPHIRRFLTETLEELGFVARECARAAEVNAVLKTRDIDLIVIGLLTPESDIGRVLHVLSMSGYRGKVMLFGARASMALLALHDLGAGIGGIGSRTALKATAKRFANSEIAISVADLMTELSVADIKDLRVSELCMIPEVVAGCADDHQKRAACSKLRDLAKRLGARATAKGLAAPQDFRSVCDLGFHFGQGELLGKPVEPRKLARGAFRGRLGPPP